MDFKKHCPVSKKDVLKFIFFLFAVSGILFFAVQLIPYIKIFSTPEGQNTLVQFIRSQGVWGLLCFLLIQIIQVVIFIIPGEFVEVAAGVIYGTGWGFLFCTLGIALGSCIIYAVVRYFGYDFIIRFIPQKNFKKFHFLKNEKNLELLVFILFFIPGTPKDALTYFIPFTHLSLKKFIILSSIARIPSILSSTFAGTSLHNGNLSIAVLCYCIIGITALVGICVNKKILDKHNP